MVLLPNGLEIVDGSPSGAKTIRLGADPDVVVAALTALWGPPDLDTGWEPGASSRYGVCPGRSRGAEWNSLAVLFSDGATGIAPAGRRHFFGWLYGTPGETTAYHGQPESLATPEGLTAGSTIKELRHVYGTRLRVADTDAFGPYFLLEGPPEPDLSGYLSDLGAQATVEVLAAGVPCPAELA